jgi:hypothetical protein
MRFLRTPVVDGKRPYPFFPAVSGVSENGWSTTDWEKELIGKAGQLYKRAAILL